MIFYLCLLRCSFFSIHFFFFSFLVIFVFVWLCLFDLSLVIKLSNIIFTTK